MEPEAKPEVSEEERVKNLTLEAYADTIVPGEKRFPDDHAIAGVSPGPGAVAAGALDLLHFDATGVTVGLPYLAQSLNDHAKSYAGRPASSSTASSRRSSGCPTRTAANWCAG